MAASVPETRPSSGLAVLALGLAIIGAASMLYYHFGLFMPRVIEARVAKHQAGELSFGIDFYPIWLTSRRWLRDGLDPYGPALTREIQVALLGRPMDGQFPTDPPNDYRRFAYPAYTDLLFWPMSEISFRPLRIAWVALLAVLLAAAIIFWARALSWNLTAPWLGVVVLLTWCSYPELEGLYAGQLGLLVGFLLAAALLALVRNRLVLAGTLMALTMIKPQMVLLAIVYLFFWSVNDWRRRRRFMMAFFGIMFLLVAASLLVLPGWIHSWLDVIRGYPHYSMPPLANELLGSTLRSHIGTPVLAALLIAALGLAWRGRAAAIGSYEFWLTLSVVLAVTTIALLPGQSVCDHIILLPGIFLLASRIDLRDSTPMFRCLLALGVALLLWPWLAAVGLILVRPFLSPELFYSRAIFVLPVRTAAVFPFVVLGLLVLALRRSQLSAKAISSQS